MSKPVVSFHDGDSAYDIRLALQDKWVEEGQAFKARVRVGKRWKFKSGFLYGYTKGECECCGAWQGLQMRVGGHDYELDNHLGDCFFSLKTS